MGDVPIYFTRRGVIRTFIVCLIFLFLNCFSHAEGFQAEYCSACMDNGASAVCYYMPESPIVTIEIRVLSGLSNEGRYAGSGISHFLEHLLFKGTKNKTEDELRRSVKNMGGIINGSTGRDSAEYHITVPKENFKEALNILFEMVTEAVFTDEEMKTEREVILKEMGLHHDDPISRRMRLLFQKAYRSHIYKYPIIGYEESFKNLSKTDILAYHNAVYTPDRMVIGIAGGVPPEIALNTAKETFKEFRRVSSWETEIFEETDEPRKVEKKFPAEVTLGYMAIGFHMTSVYSPDLYAGDVLNILLAGGNGSVLYKKLVNEKKLLYTISGYNYTPEFPGLFIVTGIGAAQNLDAAREEIFSAIGEVKKRGPKLDEIKRAKNMVISGYLHAHEKTGTIVSSMTSSQIFMGRPDFFEKYVEGIKSVAKERVNEVLFKYLKEENSTTVFLLPEDLLKGQGIADSSEDKIETSEKVKKITTRPRNEFIRQRTRREKRVESKVDISEKRKKEKREDSPEKEFTRLENGLKIIVQKRGDLPLVSVTFASSGGVRAETPETSGISNLMTSLILKGTRNLSEDEIIPVLEELGGDISVFSGMDAVGVRLDVLAKDFDLGMDIFEDVIKNAVFREEEILKQKEKITAFIAERNNNIFENGVINLRKLLYGDHPYALCVEGEKETVNAVSRDEIISFYKEHFMPGRAVITVVGDIDVNKVTAEIKKRFASSEGNKTSLSEKKVHPLKNPQKKDIMMNKEQALFISGFPGVKKDDERRYVLDVISSLLSGSDGLLFESLRKEEGLSYASGAVSVPEADTGYFVLYAATTEENLKKTGRIVSDIIKKLKAGDVSREEISSSKKRLISQWADSIETNLAVSMTMALGELYGLGSESYKEYPDRINAVSRKDIIKSARNIFNRKNSATVLIHSDNIRDVVLTP